MCKHVGEQTFRELSDEIWGIVRNAFCERLQSVWMILEMQTVVQSFACHKVSELGWSRLRTGLIVLELGLPSMNYILNQP
jgi:hypothetical protein